MKEYDPGQRVLPKILADKAATVPDRPYLQYQDGPEVSYREVDLMTNRIANGLSALGVKKGDKVALLLPNSLEAIYLWFGCNKLGVVDVPINLANKGWFLSHVINDSESKILVIDRQFLDRLYTIKDDLSTLNKIVVWSPDGSTEPIDELGIDILDYNELCKASDDRPSVDLSVGDIQTIIYTSGTTGPSKGVMCPYGESYLAAVEYCKSLKVTDEDIFYTCLPVFHANARWLCVYPAMLAESKVVAYARLSATGFWDQIRTSGATIFNSLGAMGSFIFNQPQKDDDADNPVRACMAAPMPKEIFDDFEKRFDLKIVEAYGLTETGVITYNPYDATRKGTCGKPTESFEIQILDENEYPLASNKIGEIAVRGRLPYAMCLGYYNQPEKTTEAFRNFIFHTGDAGYIDDAGYMYFVDRMKDYIRRRGENISSFEVERVVLGHPKVMDAAAIGVKSEVGEDEVKVVVVPATDEGLSPEELIEWCVPRMPYFAVPRFIEFVGQLPKTPNEKVQKHILREAGLSDNTWDREAAGIKVSR